MNDPAEICRALLQLSHDLGAEHRELAILGEGNTSAKLSDGRFLVKASGTNLATLREEQVVECQAGPLLKLMAAECVADDAIDEQLLRARVSPDAKKPSVEALFHAWLLTLPGINFVGHTHPVAVNQILCSPQASTFASERIFPDQVVCCGAASVLVPYADPGRELCVSIAAAVGEFRREHQTLPRVILLENHGVITLGATANAVRTAMYMTDKAARIYVGASALGGPIMMQPEDVERIAGRSDEHYRQRALGM